MIVRYLLAALCAGLVVGLIMTPVQYAGTIPLIKAAEVYENAGGGGHDHHAATADEADWRAQVVPAVYVESDAAKPILVHSAGGAADGGFDPARLFGTLLANLVTGAGFALMLAGVSLLLGPVITLRNGALWGLAGFGAIVVAPALGLPPELPAMPAADVVSRQIWWLGTALATAAALYALVFVRGPVAIAIGVALLVAPHLIGAPQPDDLASPVPATLAAEFVMTALLTGAIFWSLLGVGLGYALDRFGFSRARPA